MAARLPFDPTSLARHGRVLLTVRDRVEGFLTGLHRSPFRGASVEFAEHRAYTPGDEIRHIDWRAFGKTDRYHVKEYEEETNLRLTLVLDASGSMGYAGRTRSKLAHAIEAAAALAYLAARQRDAVGLAVHDTHLRHWIAPRTTTKHLLHLAQVLETLQPAGETDPAAHWFSIAGRLPRRGLIVLLSDCLGKSEGMMRAWRALRRRGHTVVLLHILAPEELEFPFRRRTRFRNLEVPGDQVVSDPVAFREGYLAAVQNFCADLRRCASLAGIDYLRLRTDEPVDRVLGAYLAGRSRAR